MFSLYGKESISIMFAVFSVGVTLFASSSSFPFVNEDDTNQMRKLHFLIDFDNSTATIKEREKFILYNAELARDNRKLTAYGSNLDYAESKTIYNDVINSTSHNDKAFLSLAMIPVYYNAGDYTAANYTLTEIKEIEITNPNIQGKFIPISKTNLTINDILKKSDPKNSTFENFSDEEKIMMKYWYASYVLTETPGEFLGCSTNIFNNKNIDLIERKSKEKQGIEKIEKFLKDKEEIEIEELREFLKNEKIEIVTSFLKEQKSNIEKILKKTNPKCTHDELRFIDNMIDDLNYESYYFDIGNKYQSSEKIFYQDEIRKFFEDYMNWLIIGVVLIVLVGWTTITKSKEQDGN